MAGIAEIDGVVRGGRRVRRVELACRRERGTVRSSGRTAQVSLLFGLPMQRGPCTIIEPASVSLEPGRIVAVLGPSGSGKSTVLAQIERRFAGACSVQRVTFPTEVAVIDRIAPWASIGEAISMLTSCGLSQPRFWIQRFRELSVGEQYRARLARALALQARAGSVAPLLCDEFCSTLHRRVAKAIAFNLRKITERRKLMTVVACCHEDLVADLRPQFVVRLSGHGRCVVEPGPNGANRSLSIRRGLHIEPGSKRDYDAFAAMHYRQADELGFVDKVFVMRERAGGDPVGIVVYAHGPLGLSLRNRATNGRFSGNPERLNREVRILRRLVVHPDIHGCGLGHYLVRKTLPRVGTEYVECLAAMGEFNPVFEKAGMKRIGRYDLPPKSRAALESLRALGADPADRDFTLQVARRRQVRHIVASTVRRWYAATTGGGEDRVPRQAPDTLAQTFRGLIGSRPVYYLWRRRSKTSEARHKRQS